MPGSPTILITVGQGPIALAVRAGFEPCSRRNLLDRKLDSISHSLSLSSAQCPDMTEIKLKRT